MAAARLASTVLAGRRRAASVVIAAGPRYGGGGGGVHVHPWAAFPSPTLPPKPRAFSSSGSLGRRDGGAPRGGSFLGWTKTVDLDLSRILTNMEMLVKTTGSHKALLEEYAQTLEKLTIAVEKNERSKGSLATTSLFLMASVVTISFGVYFFGVFTGRVDVNGFLKGFIIDILDDPTISVKMHDYVDDLAGSAVESINPIKRFVHWLSGQPRPAHYQKLNEEILNYYTDWSSILAFAVNSIAKSEGGKISEKALWRFLINVGEFVMPAAARGGPKSKPSH
uniref:Uncharacterized protein n=1 Tax=Oryza glumipatula TaxID=40148 RepID=A0A0E0AFT5_9ORYZ